MKKIYLKFTFWTLECPIYRDVNLPGIPGIPGISKSFLGFPGIENGENKVKKHRFSTNFTNLTGMQIFLGSQEFLGFQNVL